MLEAVVVVIAAINALALVLIGDAKCDESCAPIGQTDASWRDRADAWQWDAISWCGFLSCVGAALTIGALRSKRRSLSLALGAVTVVLVATGWILAAS